MEIVYQKDRLNKKFEISDLDEDTKYNISIKTEFDGTEMDPPCLLEVHTFTKLQAPINLSSKKIANDSFSLSWDDVTTHLTGYKLKIKKVRENKLILDEIIPSTRKNMKVSGLLPSVKYKVDIATIRKERKSEFKTIAITTLPNPPKITGPVSLSF